ncbi:unnamed protein product, partial [Ceratitis capitata]
MIISSHVRWPDKLVEVQGSVQFHFNCELIGHKMNSSNTTISTISTTTTIQHCLATLTVVTLPGGRMEGKGRGGWLPGAVFTALTKCRRAYEMDFAS